MYDVAEPIVGYRWWLAEGGWLHSAAFDMPWSPTMAAQECALTMPVSRVNRIHPHLFLGNREDFEPGKSAPCRRHCKWGDSPYGCGLYAFKRLTQVPAQLRTYANAFVDLRQNAPVVCGRVLLAGRIIPHEGGYRAEKARIDCLYRVLGANGTHATGRIAGVPVAPNHHLKLIALAYGVPIEDWIVHPVDMARGQSDVAV